MNASGTTWSPPPGCEGTTLDRAQGRPFAASVLTADAVLLALLTSLNLAFCAHFYVNRTRNVHMFRRSFPLLCVAAFGTINVVFTVSALDLIGHENFPCWLIGLLIHSQIPLLTVPLITRLARFRSDVARQKALLRRRIAAGPGASTSQGVAAAVDFELKHVGWAHMWAYIRFLMSGPRRRDRHSATPNVDPKQVQVQTPPQLPRDVADASATASVAGSIAPSTREMAKDFIASPRFYVFWFVVSITPFVAGYLVFVGIYPFYTNGCTGCELTIPETSWLLALVAVFFSAGIASAYRVWRFTTDSLGLVPEFFATWIVGGSGGLGLLFFVLDPAGLQFQDRTFNWRWITCCTCTGMTFCQSSLQVFVAQRRIETLGLTIDAADAFDIIMAKPTRKQALREHMADELSLESLDFVEAVDAWKATYEAQRETRQRRARAIYDEFLHPRSPRLINVPADVFESTAKVFGRGNVPPTAFDEAREEVMRLIFSDVLPRFLAKEKKRAMHQQQHGLAVLPSVASSAALTQSLSLSKAARESGGV